MHVNLHIVPSVTIELMEGYSNDLQGVFTIAMMSRKHDLDNSVHISF